MTTGLLTVELRNELHIVQARRRARDIASLLGFEKQDCVRIATTVSEIARNSWRYAGGGRVEFRLVSEGEAGVFEIIVHDHGPGIANLDEILEGRYHSTTGMGMGILSGRRLMERFDIQTSPQGTVVRLGKIIPARTHEPLPAIADHVTDALLKLRASDPVAEIEEQNRELLQSLAALEKSQVELSQLNRELEETNRGVVALYAELDDRAQEIQRIVDLKSRFLSNITHEFRTPLNSIISISRMLLERVDGELTDEQEKQARYINRAARDLSDLVNDLLDLAKTESCKIDITPSVVSVNELFATLRGMLRPLIEHNTVVTLSFDAPHPPVEMVCDERKLSQILRNLISNALKYTPAGEVRVSARVDGPRIIFCVQDTGIGIPEEHQDKIFEEFYQVRNPLQQKTKGTGLGLALCRRLAELLGGGITLESTVGLGTSFWVNLPLIIAPLPDASKPPDSSHEKEAPRLVLFVDDRVEILFGYERLLEHTPYRAILARNPQEALDILNRVAVSAIMTTSVQIVQTLATALPAAHAPAPPFIVAGDASAGDAASYGLIHAFIPASPRVDQLLACLQKLPVHPRLIALIVDENYEARQLLRILLEEFHLIVIEAGTAGAALTLIKERHPALVFTETILPDQSGIDLIALLHGALKEGSLIVHSSQVFTDDERDYLKRNAAELIRKGPVNDPVYRTSIIQEIARAGRPSYA